MANDEKTLPAPADRGIPESRLAELREGIMTALNGPYYALQVAIGQTDGGVASMHASGWDYGKAAELADRIVAAGWNGEQVPAWVPEHNSDLLPALETVDPDDMSVTLVETAVDDFLRSVAGQCGVDAYEAFPLQERDALVRDFQSYLSLETAYRNMRAP